MHAERLMIVVSAPSGAGKTSLCEAAAARLPHLVHSVSFTTRAPRPEEKEGRDYSFVSEETFRRMVDRGEFAEWARVYGHLYGTSRVLLEKHSLKGLDVILDIDTQGAAILRKAYPRSVSVFIVPPTFSHLEGRLRNRGSDSEDEVERRLRRAREEIPHYREYDYVIVNDRFETAVDQLCAIITAERQRSFRVSLGSLTENLGISPPPV